MPQPPALLEDCPNLNWDPEIVLLYSGAVERPLEDKRSCVYLAAKLGNTDNDPDIDYAGCEAELRVLDGIAAAYMSGQGARYPDITSRTAMPVMVVGFDALNLAGFGEKTWAYKRPRWEWPTTGQDFTLFARSFAHNLGVPECADALLEQYMPAPAAHEFPSEAALHPGI